VIDTFRRICLVARGMVCVRDMGSGRIRKEKDMQETEFEKRWAAIYEWVAAPRVVLLCAAMRVVARRYDTSGLSREPIEIVVEHLGEDALGVARWLPAEGSFIVRCYSEDANCHAWLALMEKARDQEGSNE